MARAAPAERAWFFVEDDQVDGIQVTCGQTVYTLITEHFHAWTSFRIPEDIEIGTTCSSDLGDIVVVAPRQRTEFSLVRIAEVGEEFADCDVACRDDNAAPIGVAASVATFEATGTPFFIKHRNADSFGLITFDGRVRLRESVAGTRSTTMKWEAFSTEDPLQLVGDIVLPNGTATPPPIDMSSLPLCEELNGCVIR